MGGERIGFGFYQSCGNRGSVGHVSVFGLCRGKWVGELGPGMEVLCLYVCESELCVYMAGPGICILC